LNWPSGGTVIDAGIFPRTRLGIVSSFRCKPSLSHAAAPQTITPVLVDYFDLVLLQVLLKCEGDFERILA
jgi:hypothetical protein